MVGSYYGVSESEHSATLREGNPCSSIGGSCVPHIEDVSFR